MANDHYVPRFYLRNFEIPTKPGRIYSYRRNLKPRPMGIKSVASEEDFDLLKTNNPFLGADFVAKLLKKTEDDAAPVIRRLVNAADFNLTRDEYQALAVFITHLAHRNPYSRSKMKNLFTEVHIARLKVRAGDRAGFEAYARSRGYDGDEESIERLRQKTLNFDEHFRAEPVGPSADDLFLLINVLFAQTADPFLLSKHWVLLNSQSRKSLVTSDNPVVILPPEDHHPALGYGVGNGMVHLPLSPRRALMMVNRKPPEPVINISRDSVVELNEQVVLHAHRSVFSDSPSREIQELFDETREGHNTRIRVS